MVTGRSQALLPLTVLYSNFLTCCLTSNDKSFLKDLVNLGLMLLFSCKLDCRASNAGVKLHFLQCSSLAEMPFLQHTIVLHWKYLSKRNYANWSLLLKSSEGLQFIRNHVASCRTEVLAFTSWPVETEVMSAFSKNWWLPVFSVETCDMTYGSILQLFFNFLHSLHCFGEKAELAQENFPWELSKGTQWKLLFQLVTVKMIIDRCLAHTLQ